MYFEKVKTIEEWYNNEENYKIILITENETAIYQVFSVYKVEDEDYYIQTYFEDDTTCSVVSFDEELEMLEALF